MCSPRTVTGPHEYRFCSWSKQFPQPLRDIMAVMCPGLMEASNIRRSVMAAPRNYPDESRRSSAPHRRANPRPTAGGGGRSR